MTVAEATNLIRSTYQQYLGRSPRQDEINIHLGWSGSPSGWVNSVKGSPEAQRYAASRQPRSAPAQAAQAPAQNPQAAAQAMAILARPPEGDGSDIPHRYSTQQAQERDQAQRTLMDLAKVIPGAKPTYGVLPDSTILNMQKFKPETKADPITQAYAKLALQNQQTPSYFQAGAKNAPGRGLELRGNPSAEEQSLGLRFLSGDNSVAGQLANMRMGRVGAVQKSNPTLDKVMKGVTLGAMATGFGALGGAALGPLLGSGGLGLSGAGLGAAKGVGSGALAGATGSTLASGGDPNAVLRGALGGGLTGGISGGLGAALPGGAAYGALRGAGVGAAGNLASSALGGRDIDWASLARSVGTGAAAGGLSGTGDPIAQSLAKLIGPAGSVLHSALAPAESTPTVTMEPGSLQGEQERQRQMQAAQDEWKRKYGEAMSERERQMGEAMAAMREQMGTAQAAQLEKYRAYQQEYESKLAEYEAQKQAMIEARMQQINQVLQSMNASQPTIAALIAERRGEIETQRQTEEAQTAKTRESRQFFPSAVLGESPGVSPFQTSDVMVPHSPASVSFGAGNDFPSSFASYGGPATPEFTDEGFLPSGVAQAAPPASVSPLMQPQRRFPALLAALARAPYLKVG